MDATLKELTSLVKEVYPEARKKGTHFSFAIVYPDPRGKVYRLVLQCIVSAELVNMCALHIETCPFLLLQVERHRQHYIRQEGR